MILEKFIVVKYNVHLGRRRAHSLCVRIHLHRF